MIGLIDGSRYLTMTGLHAHIGSQIFDLRAYDALIERLMKFIKKLKIKHMIEIRQLDLGGGFGVRYTDDDEGGYHPGDLQKHHRKMRNGAFKQ